MLFWLAQQKDYQKIAACLDDKKREKDSSLLHRTKDIQKMVCEGFQNILSN
jgi:hypothetical protein